MLLAAWLLSAGGLASAQTPLAPETASGWQDKPLVHSNRRMIVAAHPLAVEAGLQMLAKGGSAVDAAIAAQLVLNLVEPQSSGIGGGGFMLHYAARSRRLDTYDGRETAPAAAGADLLLGADGRPLDFRTAVVGGRSVGTPGLLRMLALAHREHGRLSWSTLFLPAIRIAYGGFAISPRLARSIEADVALCREMPARRYFCDERGRPKPAGARLRNPEFGDVLLQIAFNGADAFYRGAIAHDIVATVRNHPGNPGRLEMADLAGYSAVRRDAVCAGYRGRWTVCGMAAPSSGGIGVLQTLGLVERFDLAALEPQSAAAVHLISEAYRLAYADRARYVADPAFVAVPQAGLIDPRYLKRRAQAIDPRRSLGEPQPGLPAGAVELAGADRAADLPATTHMSIIDDAGNVVSMTSSIESAFGSKQVVRGFLLNNQLTDFSFAPADAQGRPVANRVEAGKRPRSTMAPTIVFDRQGRVRLVVGSPGGAGIIQYVTKVLIGVLDWRLDIREAIRLGNFGAMTSSTTTLERGTPVESLRTALQKRGHAIRIDEQTSGLHGFTVDYAANGTHRISGAADPRREGVAAGEPAVARMAVQSTVNPASCPAESRDGDEADPCAGTRPALLYPGWFADQCRFCHRSIRTGRSARKQKPEVDAVVWSDNRVSSSQVRLVCPGIPMDRRSSRQVTAKVHSIRLTGMAHCRRPVHADRRPGWPGCVVTGSAANARASFPLGAGRTRRLG
ncbi:MAG: gamma-glutamyltransferase [Sterolibacteriaceae bacterium]|uniref:Glutathione hydrolase proenzyme n=1 Tax=Candidatus Methylophosphatis roskildensis TaxID=2899263 RepID=A0A9D7HL33_9PROT|nr:gamma-glutamyltransferase [Candidatus Methylophosphatis roskildensis]